MHISVGKFAIIFSVASALLLSALFLQWYVAGKIEGYEYMLSLNGLSEYDIGMLTGTLEWWIIQKSMLFDPISYLIIASGIVTYAFGISTRVLSFRKESHQPINQEPVVVKKSHSYENLDKELEIKKLKNKITKYEKQLAFSNHRINNLKENMDYLVKIINETQEKNKPILLSK